MNRYTLPAFLLVLFGLAWFVLVTVRLSHGPYGFHAGLLLATLPLVIVETWLYWFIQTKNAQREASLIHILLLMLALASLFLREGLYGWYFSRHSLNTLHHARHTDRVQYMLFAGLFAIAHIFFFRVLRSAFTKQSHQL
jgi:hypothetical protein